MMKTMALSVSTVAASEWNPWGLADEAVAAGVQQLDGLCEHVAFSTTFFEKTNDAAGMVDYNINVTTQCDKCTDDEPDCQPDPQKHWRLEVGWDFGYALKNYAEVDRAPQTKVGNSIRDVVIAGVQEMNGWVNSMCLNTLLSLELVEQKNNEQGPLGIVYGINVITQCGNCRNGEKKVDDADCMPDFRSPLQLWHLEVSDMGEQARNRYMLMDLGPVSSGSAEETVV